MTSQRGVLTCLPAMPTLTQDPADPFTPRIEELLRERDAAHGIGRPVVVLLCDLFIYLMRMMAAIAERGRNGELPATAPEAALDGGTMHGLFEQPEMPAEIIEPIAEPPREMPPCEVPGIEQPAGLPLPRRARVRKLKVSSGQAPARPQHVDHGGWPQWRGAGVLWTTEVGFLRFDSKKRVLTDVDMRVHFVSI